MSGLVGSVGLSISGGSGTTESPIKKAKIDFNTIATHAIIAAVTSRQIVLTNIVFVTTAAQSITLKDDTTAITGAMALGDNGGLAIGGRIELTTNKPFQITNTVASQVSGWVEYYEK